MALIINSYLIFIFFIAICFLHVFTCVSTCVSFAILWWHWFPNFYFIFIPLLFFFLDYTCSTKFIYSKDDFDIWLTQKYIMNIMKNIKFKNLKIYTYLNFLCIFTKKLIISEYSIFEIFSTKYLVKKKHLILKKISI